MDKKFRFLPMHSIDNPGVRFAGIVPVHHPGVYLAVILILDNHCACGKVAHPIAVLGKQNN